MMLNVAYTLGRILLPLVFIVSGVQKLMNVAGIAKMLADNNVPIPDEIMPYLGGLPKFEAAGYAIGAVELICGLMVLTGFKARWGALVLVVFTACTIFFIHHFWDMQGIDYVDNMQEALKYLAIMGGLLLVAACGAGPSTLDRP
jgi:putative oxidoreductase